MTIDPVREFYTQHPYPPPVENLDRARDEWRDENRHRADFHLFWPATPYKKDLNVLIAGCGTWQAARHALCRPAARVTGIDISTTSLEQTQLLQRKYDLTNLETQLLPIERAAELNRSFDLIISTGVLHHLADPDAGLRALRSVLKPDGAMYLMVYAPYGRTGVTLLQDYCRRLGIGTSPRDIQDLMTVLKTLPPQHPLAALMRGSRDAANPDAMADALLNPRDRSYSVPQLFDFIESNGLAFQRWYSQASYLPQCGAIAATPHAARLNALPDREQYAAMELWRGTMATHSVIVTRDDNPEHPAPRDLLGWPQWMLAVPIRLPGTTLVVERLPPGAAGALVSRYHSSTDLVLIIDAQEKRMFEAIDGRRTIAAIVERAAGQRPPEHARTFFDKLYRYDQVVFDATQAR